jgi:type III pantothenate kinase
VLLVIDVGNTNTAVGLFDGAQLVQQWRIESRKSRTSDEYGILLSQLIGHAPRHAPASSSASGAKSGPAAPKVDAAILSSVVPPLGPTFERTCLEYFNVRPLVVGPGIRTGMPIRYENPREVGADRIVNAVAAYERVRGAAIVVDFGTATTFDAVSADGAYLGGAISPGVGGSTEALFHYASKLPRVELARPRAVIGRNTVESMQSGIVYGFLGLVDGVVQRMRAELPVPARVLATGGFAHIVAAESATIDEIVPTLTLDGLRILYERNA